MSTIKINNIDLAKFCYARVKGIDVREVKDMDIDPQEKTISFGEFRKDGEPLWAANLYNFRENDCTIDLTLNHTGLLSHRTLKRMAYVVFDYIFNQCNLERCTTTVRESNIASIRITKAFGLKIEGIKRNAYTHPIENMVMFGMLKEECLWLGEQKNGHRGYLT